MAASVSGSKTCSNAPLPQLSAATLTTLMNTPIEALTVSQFMSLYDGLKHVSAGLEPTKTLGQIFV